MSTNLTPEILEEVFKKLEEDALNPCRSYDTWGAFNAEGKLLGQLIEHSDNPLATTARLIRVEVNCK